MSSALFSKQNLLCRLAEQQHCRKLSMCDCVHTQKMSLTTLIQNRGCRRYTFTQYTTSSKQRTCRTTIFINTFIVWLFAHKRCCCTTLTTLTHTEGVVHIYVYTVYNKQQTATGNFLAKKGAIRPSARCHFATNYQLFCQYIFHPYNISATLSFSIWYWYQYGLVIGFKWILNIHANRWLWW